MRKGSRQLYRKMSVLYTTVLVGVVGLLALYSISESRQQVQETNLEYMRMAGKEARDYLSDASDIADHIHATLYDSYVELDDLCHYLQDDTRAYMEYRLDNYGESSGISYAGIEDFVSRTFGIYSQLEQIQVYSPALKILTRYEKDGSCKREAMTPQQAEAAGNGSAAQKVSFRKILRDPVSLEEIGWMELGFSTKKFQDIVLFYDRAGLLVCGNGKEVVYDSDPTQVWDMAKGTGELEKMYNLYIVEENIFSYHIYTYMTRRDANHIPLWRFGAILIVGVALVCVGEMGIRFYLSGIMKRLNTIVTGMERVKTGDLHTRIALGEKGDELDIIADNFNSMCRDLDIYIKKSYLAEIEQKNAEMAALQSQINPHFLYNTLEAIRMKAICNGDREVGRMLYCMAAMFQSQLKAADVIVLAQELHYCKKYMELFEYRYHDKFRWEVNCEERFLQIPVIKFVIQPILENYFAHGIRLESDTNFISLNVEEDGAYILVRIDDNGRGMTLPKIQEKNAALRADEFDSHKSMGLANVNRRLRTVYGEECGVFLAESMAGGLEVTVKFRKEENERAV